MTAATQVWEGSPALRESLARINELEPFPGNPRRGDVAAIRASLARFGQVRPILVDGQRIVAGHHLVEAARELGWTHVAVTRNEFADEAEARAYLVADNRIPDLGGYDEALLVEQLRATGNLEGTGYSAEEVADLDAKLRASLAAPDEFPELDPDRLETQYRCPACQYEWSGQPRPGGEAAL